MGSDIFIYNKYSFFELLVKMENEMTEALLASESEVA